MPSTPDFSETEETFLWLELFLQSHQLFPNTLVLIMSMRVESDPLLRGYNPRGYDERFGGTEFPRS